MSECRRGWVAAFGVCILGVIGALAGCGRQEAAPVKSAAAAVPVTLAPVKIDSVQRVVEVTGTLWGDEDATISSKMAGRAIQVFKDIGETVKSGEPLVQISPVDFELARRQKELAAQEPLAKLGLSEMPGPDFDVSTVPSVRRASIQADNAEARYNRGKQIHDQTNPLLSDQDFADLKTAWDVAKSAYDVELLTARALVAQAKSLRADLDMASQRLTDSTVRAPGAERTGELQRNYSVAARMVSQGEYVKEGTPLFRLIDYDKVKLRSSVNERYMREVKVDQEVRINVAAYAEDFTGKVTRINPQVDPASRTFEIEVVIPNDKHLLKPGSFVEGRVLTRLDDGVVFLPQESVISFAGVNKVFTVLDGKAVEHAVELGERHDSFVEARGELGSKQVVVEGASKLASGVLVTVRPAGPPASAPSVPAVAEH